MNKPKYILIHCTDYPRQKMPDQFKACNQWHKDRDFPKSSIGYHIGYHVLITGEQLHVCRLDEDEGAHCNQRVNGVSMNFQSLSVCIGFDGDIEDMTSKEYAFLQEQIWKWQDQYGIPNENVKFHRDFAVEKTCPGVRFDAAWLSKLLTRPIVVNDIPVKPEQNMCKPEKDEIVELKKQLAWYESIFQWIAEKWS